MKIAAFYENIKTGAEHASVSMEEALLRLKKAGLDNIYADYRIVKEDQQWLFPLLEKTGIGTEGLYGFTDFVYHPDEEVYKECVDLALRMGAGNILLVPGMVEAEEEEKREELIENMRLGLEKASAYAGEKGIVVTLEDFDGMTAPYNCLEGIRWFLENTKGLYCAFDTGNFIMYQEDVLDAFEVLKSHIITVHVKDRSKKPVNPGDQGKLCRDGSIVYPCPVGRGYIPVREIIERLKKIGYNGGLTAEMYDCDPDCMLAELINSVKYLKACTGGT